MTAEPTWGYADLRGMVRNKPDMTPAEISFEAAERMTAQQLRDFAEMYLADWVKLMRRHDALHIEKDSERPVEPEQPPQDPFAVFKKWMADPVTYWRLPNARVRAAFMKWAGDRFPAWHAAARQGAEAALAEDEYAVEIFEGDWYPGGVMAYERKLRKERLEKDLRVVIDSVSRDVRLETTRELMDSMFAIGNGQQVSWGSATVADHRLRISLLMRNLTGTTETAARHQAAIRMIEDAGVSTLADLAVPA